MEAGSKRRHKRQVAQFAEDSLEMLERENKTHIRSGIRVSTNVSIQECSGES